VIRRKSPLEASDALTLLIPRGRSNRLTPATCLPFTRVRVTRCWSLMSFMLDFAALYSLTRLRK